jgi:hypothetical protein
MKNLFLLLLVGLFSGCAGYRIGPAKPATLSEIKSLAVPVFRNETLEPRIEALVTNTIIQQIQQDGTYRIESEASADGVLEGSIESITRGRARSVRGNVEATAEFNLNVNLVVRLTNRATGEVLHTERVTGTTTFFVGADLQQQERQAVVLAAQDAAVRLTSRISEGW